MSDEIMKRLQQIEDDVRALRRDLAVSKPAENDPKTILLQFLGGLSLCDHMGDVANDADTAMKRLGIDVGKWDDLDELGTKLGKLGVTTLHGTPLVSDDDE